MNKHALKRHRRKGATVRVLGVGALVSALVTVFPSAAHAAVSSTSDANAIAAAMTASANVTGASFVDVPPQGTPNGTSTTALAGFPSEGSSFAVLTSGDVNLIDDPNSQDDSGTSNSGLATSHGDNAFDVSTLKVNFTVPAGMNCLRFDFKFLSEEFPEYVDSGVNDAFIAELDQSVWTADEVGGLDAHGGNFALDPNGEIISVDTTGETSVSEANAAGTTFDAATPVLTAAKQVTPGAHALLLSIFDQGDLIYDSAVFLDNLVVGFAPNPQTQCAPGAQLKSYAVDLAPATAAKTVGQTHTVTATVNQVNPAGPVVEGTVLFVVAGANPTTGSAMTSGSGGATFSYAGANPGGDAIAACYDANNNTTCDTGEATASATATWSATPPVEEPDNHAPTNDAAGPYEGPENTAIPLAGTAVDEDEDELTHGWTYTGPGECAFSDAASLTSTVTCDTVGTYTLTLTTNDGSGPVTDTATLTVCPPKDDEPDNGPPVNDAHGPYSGFEAQPITLAGAASDPDEDDLTHEWTYTGPGECTFSDPEALDSTVTCDEPGTYQLKLSTSDGDETVVDKAKLHVTCAVDDDVEPAPTPTIPTTPTTTPAAAPSTLPVTGSSVGSIAASGLFLIGLGIAALAFGRRRREITR